jgi:hypothetical protein
MTQPNTDYQNYTKYRHFAEMRRKDERLYWSPAVQEAMHKIAQQLGENFFIDDPQPRNPSNGQFVRDSNPPISEREEERAIILRALAKLDNMKIEESNDTTEEANSDAQ